MLSLTVPRLALRAAAPTRQFAAAVRYASTKTLKDAVAEIIPGKQEQLKKLKAQHGESKLGEIQLQHLLGGMRGLKVMLWEGSVLDSETGITFHGKSIPESQKVLPTAAHLGLNGNEIRKYPNTAPWPSLLILSKVIVAKLLFAVSPSKNKSESCLSSQLSPICSGGGGHSVACLLS